MILPIVLTATGAAALLNIWLAVRVGQVRTREKVSIGDGGNEAVIRRMRAHSNFVEFTPIVLILIAVIELAKGTSPTWLWVAAAVYIIGRILHALGMDDLPKGRMIGTMTTMLVTVILGIYALALPHLLAGQVEPEASEAVANG